MKYVMVEGCNKITGSHFGGFYDLDTPEGKTMAEHALSEMRKVFSHVRYTPVAPNSLLGGDPFRVVDD